MGREIAVNIKFLRVARAMYGEGTPAPATEYAAGFDLRADLPEGEGLTIQPGERAAIPTGIAIEPLNNNVAAFIYSRSGLGAVQGVTVAQGVGLVDPDYRGEVTVFLLNTGNEARTIKRAERVAQLVFQEFYRPKFNVVAELGDTARGSGGFGHTGQK